MEQENLPNKVSNRRLKISYWYVSHKIQLRGVLVGFLIVISLGLYSFSIYRLLMILVVDGPNYQQAMQQLPDEYINYTQHRQDQMAIDLQVDDFVIVPVRDGRSDYIATVFNPNPNFTATEITVQLVSGTAIVAEKTSFVLPNQKKYITFFGQEFKGGDQPVFKITETKWQRVHFFENEESQKLRFEVNNLEFKDARSSGLRGELPVSTLTFDISNNSAFSYWNVGIYMMLKNQSRIVAGNYIALDQFLAGQTRAVEMRWYENIPSVNSTEVLAEVNILDPEVYMAVQ